METIRKSKYSIIKETLKELKSENISVRKTNDWFIRISFNIKWAYYKVDYPSYYWIAGIVDEIKKHFINN